MRNTKAIFIKQTQSIIKNLGILINMAAFLLLALVFMFLTRGDHGPDDCGYCITAYTCAECAAAGNGELPDLSTVGLFTVMFAGMSILSTAASLIIEDKATQNLRFMAMAGMKPRQYLTGTGVSLILVSFAMLVMFSTIGGYFGADMLRFLSVTMLGSLVSILLGIVIGLSKVPALAMPLAMVLGMGPVLTTLNPTLARFFWFTYTQQIRLVLGDFEQNFSTALWVMAANGAVVLLLFVWMHRKGELWR